jgi:hypothetical protein
VASRIARILAALLIAGVVIFVVPLSIGPALTPASSAPESSAVPLADGVSFGAAGDYGYDSDMQEVVGRMGSEALSFALALGDLSYGDTSESNWCNYFESKMGDGKVLLIAGNHDSGESTGGNISIYRQYCNFGVDAPITGDYGKEFYFDFPRTSPVARFILTGCGVSFKVDGQGKWNCNAGDSHYNFVAKAIDGARSASIPWVFVGMHKNCITNGVKDCEIGEAFQDLLLSKRVDLVLQGHDHNYQRSKQLTCANDGEYKPECVADADTPFVKGKGTVLNIIGTGGHGLYPIDDTVPERQYFAVADSSSHGFTKFTLNATILQAQFIPVTGSLSDSFAISADDSPPPLVPTQVTMHADSPDPSAPGDVVNLTATLIRTDTQAPLSGKALRMEGSDDGGATWWPAGTYPTDANGRALGGVRFMYEGTNQRLRATFDGDLTFAASTSNVEPHATGVPPTSTVTFHPPALTASHAMVQGCPMGWDVPAPTAPLPTPEPSGDSPSERTDSIGFTISPLASSIRTLEARTREAVDTFRTFVRPIK